MILRHLSGGSSVIEGEKMKVKDFFEKLSETILCSLASLAEGNSVIEGEKTKVKVRNCKISIVFSRWVRSDGETSVWRIFILKTTLYPNVTLLNLFANQYEIQFFGIWKTLHTDQPS